MDDALAPWSRPSGRRFVPAGCQFQFAYFLPSSIQASKEGTLSVSLWEVGPWRFSWAMSMGSFPSFSAMMAMPMERVSQLKGQCCPLVYILPVLVSTTVYRWLMFWHFRV